MSSKGKGRLRESRVPCRYIRVDETFPGISHTDVLYPEQLSSGVFHHDYNSSEKMRKKSTSDKYYETPSLTSHK